MGQASGLACQGHGTISGEKGTVPDSVIDGAPVLTNDPCYADNVICLK